MPLQVLQACKHALTAMALEAFWLLWGFLLGLLEHVVTVGRMRHWRLHGFRWQTWTVSVSWMVPYRQVLGAVDARQA
jgi:hypothetical protein